MNEQIPVPRTGQVHVDDQDRSADDRDRVADQHDASASTRDRLADGRDDRAEARDDAVGVVDVESASDRNAARRDRVAAKGDRQHARDDRRAACSDRSLSAQERATLLIDELTGAFGRAAGFLELEREIVRAERTDEPLVLAFLDIDGLKQVNDEQGHDAGDDLLRELVLRLRAVTRDGDTIVRFGGDEFLCGLSGLAVPDVLGRLDEVNATLRAQHHASVSVGVAERRPGEGLASLIRRADEAMYEGRHRETD